MIMTLCERRYEIYVDNNVVIKKLRERRGKNSFEERRCAKDVMNNYGSLNIDHR